jgi:hypothetical protein
MVKHTETQENQFGRADIKTDEDMDATAVTDQNPSFFF